MSPHVPLSSITVLEREMIEKAQRKLDSKTRIDSIEKLRFLCLALGFNGILDFGRIFRRLNSMNTNVVNESEFLEGIERTAFQISFHEIREIFDS